MLFTFVAIIAYLSALLWVVPTLVNLEQQENHSQNPKFKIVFALGAVAVITHFMSWINSVWEVEGFNFTVANVVSLMSLLMSGLATFALPKWRTIWFPLITVYAFGLCSVTVSGFVTGSFIKDLQQAPTLAFHLGIALFSYALFFIALLYALQIKWLDKRLKSKKTVFCSLLPPLMTVERHFFTLTIAAQALLTLTLISGMITLHNFFAPEQVHKAIFSFTAWIIYSVQLLGQWKLNWRGNRVLIYSISGMILLTVGYFGSRF